MARRWTSGRRRTRSGAPHQHHALGPAALRDGISGPGWAERAPGNRAPRKPHGAVSQGNRLLRPRPQQCNLGGFSRSLPSSLGRPVPAPAAPSGPRGWLGHTRTRQGEGRRCETAEEHRGPFRPRILQSRREEKHAPLKSELQSRVVPSTLAGPCSAACPRQSLASSRAPPTLTATCAARGSFTAHSQQPGN